MWKWYHHHFCQTYQRPLWRPAVHLVSVCLPFWTRAKRDWSYLLCKILTVSTYFCWNGTILVFVKHIKGFFKGWQFIRSQLVCHFEQELQETGPAGSLKKQRKKNINYRKVESRSTCYYSGNQVFGGARKWDMSLNETCFYS